MNATKRILMAATSTVASSLFAVVFPDADNSHDLGSAEAWGGEVPTGQEVDIPAGTYYLGADVTFSKVWGAKAGTVYDFRNGEHTLTATEIREQGSNCTTEYIGGKWRGKYAPHAWGSGRDNVTSILNGTDFSGVDFEPFAYSRNSRMILTNGASLASVKNGGNPGVVFAATTNNTLEVFNGSKLSFEKNLYIGYGTTHAMRLNNKLVVSGEGSTFDTHPAGSYNLYLGVDQGDNAIVVENGGYLNSYNLKIGGVSSFKDADGVTRPGNDTAGGNTFTVRGDSSVAQIQQTSYLGFGESHSNVIYILDHASLNIGSREGGTWAGMTVGTGPSVNGTVSSYNAVVVSNASFVTRHLVTGSDAGGHDNRLDLLGPSPELYYTENEVWKMFGAGSNNVVHVGCGANFSYLQNDTTFGTAGGTYNRLVVDGNSVCTVKNLTVGDKDKVQPYTGCAIEVAGGSCLTNKTGDLGFYAEKGRLVVDDGSTLSSGGLRFEANQGLISVDNGSTLSIVGGSPAYIGATDVAVGSVFVGSGAIFAASAGFKFAAGTELIVSNGTVALNDEWNRKLDMSVASLVLKGSSPKVRSLTPTTECYMYAKDVSFEFPAEGYVEAPLRVMQFQHDASLRLSVVGLEAYQRTLKKRTDVTLIETMSDSGLLWMRETYPETLDALNASLPEGCVARVEHVTGGNDRLVLSVRALMGMAITIR